MDIDKLLHYLCKATLNDSVFVLDLQEDPNQPKVKYKVSNIDSYMRKPTAFLLQIRKSTLK